MINQTYRKIIQKSKVVNYIGKCYFYYTSTTRAVRTPSREGVLCRWIAAMKAQLYISSAYIPATL
jgi:hypothetical protein